MLISIEVTEEEKSLAEAYAKLNGITLRNLIKKVFFEKIEDEYDIALASETLRKYNVDPQTYSLKEMKELLGS